MSLKVALAKLFKREYLLFCLLPLYMLVVLKFHSTELKGDEIRYVNHATNLTKGYFIDPSHPAIHVGPAYPLILAPFVALGLPYIVPALLNVLLVFLAVLFLYKAVSEYTEKPSNALVAAICLGLYPPLFRWMPLLHYESWAVFLVCGFIYHFTKIFATTNKARSHMIWAGLTLGALMLTKYLFFYVVLCVLVLLTVLWLIKRNQLVLNGIMAFSLSIAVFAPYLVYTYNLTGKPFLAGTNGGEVLYHRTTPYPSELGNWFDSHSILTDDENNIYYDLNQLRQNHRDFYLKIEKLNPIERDSAFKSVALANIKNHPKKYIKNTVANVGRFFFHYPFSYRAHGLETYGYLIPNMVLIMICLLCLYPALREVKQIPTNLLILGFLIVVYGSAICVLGGRGRHFIIVVPFIILFITYVVNNIIKIEYRQVKD